MATDVDIVRRASAALENARFGTIARSSALEYTRVAERIERARLGLGDDWRGLDSLGLGPASLTVARAAWSRRSHLEVARGLQALRRRDGDLAQALDHLRDWLPEAEACPPHPDCAPTSGHGSRLPLSASKRHLLSGLPDGWLNAIWREAVRRNGRHLGAIAVLIVTGCRPQEVAWGVGLRVHDGHLDVAIAGAKVRGNQGQPWRLLSVAVGDDGPADHLANLASRAGGRIKIQPTCTPAALSMAVAELGQAVGIERRISAYDVRHQRAADARTAFKGDVERVAAWLGHGGVSTVRYYGRLPKGARIAGPVPVAAVTSRPVRVPARTAASEPTA